MEEVKILVLVNGQQMIGKVSDEPNTPEISVDNPRVLNPMMDQNGMRIMLIPWIFGSARDEKTIKLKKEHIMYSTDPEPELKTHYLNSVSIIKTPAVNPGGMKLLK